MAEANRTPESVYDLIVIGGGPAGATAGLYAGRAALRTLVLDRGLTAGALGSASRIGNFPGVLGEVSGRELAERIRGQAESFGVRFEQDRVLRVQLAADVKEMWGNKGNYRGRAVIVATGSMGRTQTLPGEERLLGKGVSYCATCDGFFFQDQEVAVAGGTDEAVEEGLLLARVARRVHLLVPTADLKTAPELAAQVAAHPKVAVRPATRLREIIGERVVSGVRVSSPGQDDEVIPVAGVFLYLQGGRPVTDFLAGELELDSAGCLRVDGDLQTSVPGVFAAGDVLCKHLKQAVIAAAEGARAAAAAERYLAGRESLRPDWS